MDRTRKTYGRKGMSQMRDTGTINECIPLNKTRKQGMRFSLGQTIVLHVYKKGRLSHTWENVSRVLRHEIKDKMSINSRVTLRGIA